MTKSDLPTLLRAVASGTQAKDNKHDIILNAAASELERLSDALFTCRELRKLDAKYIADLKNDRH